MAGVYGLLANLTKITLDAVTYIAVESQFHFCANEICSERATQTSNLNVQIIPRPRSQTFSVLMNSTSYSRAPVFGCWETIAA